MADARSLSVRLRAEVAGYVTGMQQAARVTNQVATEATKAATTHKKASQDVGRAAAIGGVALVGMAAAAVKNAADFDKAMSGVRAATHETATNMGLLREAALQAGADTAFSATQAADAVEQLAKAGVSTQNILGGGLRGALDLAAAGQLDVGEAAETAASAMTQFSLAGSDVPHIADLLAAGAGKAQGSVHDLGMALNQAGLVASQTGLSIEETTGGLAAFASAGLTGSDAGTSFKTMLLALNPQSDKAAGLMESLGLTAYDSQGNFIGLANYAGVLQKALGTMSNEQRNATLQTIFGRDAIRAANVLYQQGASGVRSWTAQVNDSGYAAETAAIQLDNLSGDVEKFTGSLQTALINGGTAANGFARGAVQGATAAVNAYSELPGPVQTTATVLTTVVGAAAAAGGGFLLLAPRIKDTRSAITELRKDMPKTTGAMSSMASGAAKLGIALAAGFAAFEVASRLMGTTSSDMAQFTQQVEATAGASTQSKIDALTERMTELKRESNEGWLNGEIFGYGVRLGNDAYKAGAKVFALEDRIKALKAEQASQGISQAQANNSAASYADTMAGQVSPAVQGAADAVKAYKNAIDDVNNVNITAARAQLELAAQIRESGKAGDKHAGIARKEKSALLDLAEQANRTASAVLDQSGSQEKANATLARARRAFINTAVEMGATRAAARRMADAFLSIPRVVKTDVETSGLDPTISRMADLAFQINNIPRSVTVSVFNRVQNLPQQKSATGGRISGPGTGTSDSIPLWVSNGEYVVRTAAVQKYGTHLFDQLNAMHFAGGGSTGGKKPSAADQAQARQNARGAAAAAAAAARAGAIDVRTPGTDPLGEINAAIAAVQRLSDAYAAQQAVVGMNAVERRKYHAEQRLQAVQERLDQRRTAAEARDAAKKQLATNQAAWEFDHMTEEQQLAALDTRIKGEKKYSDQWVADSKQREQIAADMAQREQQAAEQRLAEIKSALDAAIQERDQKIQAVVGSLTSFGALGDLNLGSLNGEVIGSQVGGTDVVTGGLIAASQSAKVAAARTFIGNLRTLRARGLNDASVLEIFNMGPSGGAAYAAALVADSSVLGSLNADAAEFARMGQSFGAELAGAVRVPMGTGQQPTTFNLFDSNGVLLGTMYGMADQLAGQIANMGIYGRV